MHDFKELLDRYLEGNCTPEEEALLTRFFEQSANREKDVSLSGNDRERLFTAFQQSPRYTGRKVHLLTNKLLRIAAAILFILAGLIYWQYKSYYTDRTLAYKQISSPRGKLLRVTLPDNSTVVLNANSTLRYDPDFTTHRHLQLKGEALFDVTKDETHPFIINTEAGLATKVLGTSFTVRSDAGTPETRIIVLSGRIQVQHADSTLGTLTANHALYYNRQNGKSVLLTITDAEKQTGWTKGEWEYDNMQLPELQMLMDNYYGIKVTARQTFVASANMNFTNHQTAEEIINVFCITANCHYRWVNHTTAELY